MSSIALRSKCFPLLHLKFAAFWMQLFTLQFQATANLNTKSFLQGLLQ